MSEPIYEALMARRHARDDSPTDRRPVDHAELARELNACAAYADGTRGNELVELAAFTRHRIATALRQAAEVFASPPEAPQGLLTSAGIDRIANERTCQVFEKDHDPVLDLGREGELLSAAEALLQVGHLGLDAWHNPDGSYAPPGGWPWGEAAWPMAHDRIGNLTIAGALIAAAIDALDPAIQLDRTTT